MHKLSPLAYVLVLCGFATFLFFIVYGSFMPLVKAQRYIIGLQTMSNIKSVGEFEAIFNRVFNFASPVGDEEAAKYLANDILGIVQKQQSESVDRWLVTYIEPRLQKNNPRHLISAAQMYTVLLSKYRKQEDYVKAESYYLQALKIGPKLPPALNGLFELYRGVGNAAGAKEVAQMILSNWPQDEKTKEYLESVK